MSRRRPLSSVIVSPLGPSFASTASTRNHKLSAHSNRTTVHNHPFREQKTTHRLATGGMRNLPQKFLLQAPTRRRPQVRGDRRSVEARTPPPAKARYQQGRSSRGQGCNGKFRRQTGCGRCRRGRNVQDGGRRGRSQAGEGSDGRSGGGSRCWHRSSLGPSGIV